MKKKNECLVFVNYDQLFHYLSEKHKINTMNMNIKYKDCLINKGLFLLLVSVFCSSSLLFAQLPQFSWANSIDGLSSPHSLTNSSEINDIKIDAEGNVLSVGNFYGSIDANSGSGTSTLAAVSSGAHGFIIKTSATGTLIWAKAIEGEGVSEINSVNVDANGNVYFMGVFGTDVDFNPGSGNFSLTATNYRDMFMEKLDSDGNFVWAKKIAAASGIVANSVDIDPSGNPVFVGYFSGQTDFDPNAGVVNLTGPSSSYVLKLDINGDFVFVKTFTALSLNEITDIEIKENGDMILVGRFTSATDFDPNAGVYQLSTNTQSQDAFMCQLNNNGNFMWAKKIGGGNSDVINALDVDISGNIFITGTFRNYVDFDLSSNSFLLQTSGSTLDDIFVAKYTSTGDFIWVKQIGNPDENFTDENSNDIAVDLDGNVTIVGFFYNEIDFNPGNAVFNINSYLNRNVFVCKLNPNGAFNYAFAFDSDGELAGGEAFAIDIDDNGTMYIGGHSDGVYDVNPDTNVVNNVTCEFNQGLLLKYGPSSSAASFFLESNSGCVNRTIGLQSNNSFLQTSWFWTSTGGTIVNPNSPTASISFPSNGIYTVTLTVTSDLGTTVKTQTITVNNNPSIVVQASPNIVCEGESTTLWATHDPGILRWGWFQNNTHLTIYPTADTLITATIYASNGCSASASQFIQVATDASTTISVANDTICSGDAVTLTANGAQNFVWSTGATTQSITVSPTSFSAYSVTGITGTCQATANQVIHVNSVPNISIQSSSNVSCDGASVTLTANGGVSYLWSTGETTNSIIVSPSSNTTYSVTGMNSFSCDNSSSKTITVGSAPTINLVSSNMTPCAGSTITLTAVGGVSYLWGTGQTTNSITASPATNTTYSVIGTNAAGCQTYFERTILVDPLPVIAIQSASNSVCAGSSITLTASGGDSYSWNSGQTTAAITVSPTTATTYSVTGTNSFNCQATINKTITVNQLPTVSIQSASNSICVGQSLLLNGSGANSYTWSTGQSTNSISVSPTVTTTYTVTGTNGSNCQNTSSKTITVNPLPQISIQTSESTICAGNSTNLTASGGGSYIWSTGQNSTSISVAPISTSTFILTGTSSFGCQNVASIEIEVLSFPTVDFLNPITEFCLGQAVQSFEFTPIGGVLSGIGVSGASFNPSIAGAGTHILTYTYSENTCSVSSELEVTVNDCASLDDKIGSNSIKVYPIPASDQIFLTNLPQQGSLFLSNEKGQLLSTKEFIGSEQTIDTSKLSAGVYFLNIHSDTENSIRKIVVQD